MSLDKKTDLLALQLIKIEDEGIALPLQDTIDFTGAGVTATDSGTKTTVNIPGFSGNPGHVIEDEGTPLAQQTTLNFTGAGVTVIDSGGKTVVDIPVGGDVVIGNQQIPIAASAIYPGISQGADSIKQREIGIALQQAKYIPFPAKAGLNTFAYFDWHSPKNWNGGAINCIVYWTSEAPSVAGQTIELQFAALARGDNDAIGSVIFSSVQAIQTTLNAVDEVQIDAPGFMTVLGSPGGGNWVQVRIRRKSSADNLAGEIQVLGIRLEYTINSGTSSGV